MVKIIFVRHGETEWNVLGRYQGQADISLSSKGFQQARLLADNFPFSKIDTIYSSDLVRAFQTAEILKEKFRCPLITDKNLREIDFGVFEGLTYAEISLRWQKETENFFNRPDILHIPEGESFLDVKKRGMETFAQIVKNEENLCQDKRTIVIVSHGGILRTILATILHIPLRYLWSIRQDNTAISIVSSYENYYSLELLNSTVHLQQ